MSKDAQHELTVITKAQAAEIALHLRDGESYDVVSTINSLRQIRDDISSRLFEMGRLLTLIKLNEAPDTYRKLLNDCSIAPAFASRAGSMYRKFCGGKRAALVGQLSSSKLLELMSEPEEALDELAEGGSIAGIPADDIAKMSVREVQAGLRKARADLEKQRSTQDKLVKKRDDRIADLESQLELGDQYPAADRAADLLADIAKACAQIVAATKTLTSRAGEMIKLEQDGLPPEQLEILRSQLALSWQCVQPIGDLVPN